MSSFPTLDILDPSDPLPPFSTPAKLINDGPDVAHFLCSKAYRDICLFITQLNRALCPRRDPIRTWILPPATSADDDDDDDPPPPPRATPSFASTNPTAPALPAPVQRLRALLDAAAALVADAPPDPGPRRFGNVSFRAWHALLETRASALLDDVLQLSHSDTTPQSRLRAAAKPEILAYFLGAWGSAQRLDYGTGHELSFVAFLGCLWKTGVFASSKPTPSPAAGDTERAIVLGVIEPYLAVVRRLIATYTLEPAGSHGVWGLDDHSFVPYIFGSAQLARAVADGEPTPVEGSVAGAPSPADIVKADVVARERGRNMYFSAVGFINDVKRGPFWEHSPLLFDISGVRDGWGKINKGMIKMFNAEVLSKFPVVQHFPFGALFSWDRDPDAATAQSIHISSQPTPLPPPPPPPHGAHGIHRPATGSARGPAPSAMTAAPWAQSSGGSRNAAATGDARVDITGVPSTRAPWAKGP